MLFTTATFICLFLPIVLAGFFGIARFSHAAAALWILVASIFFYGYWMPVFTGLLVGSIAGNFLVGARIASSTDAGRGARMSGKTWLTIGVGANLVLLGYYKYANFFVDNLNTALGFDWSIGKVILPIGISFFTFTQIAYLVDTWRKGVRERNLVHYGLFVTYFPHLIAGPVLHHAQMMPQFRDPSIYRFNGRNFAAGLSIFAIGMAKKVILADGVSPYADVVFNAAEAGMFPNFQEAWLGALAYTFQLYFDFSGYSDMAIGLSWMLNVRLPFNFDSPYKAANISDFWRRWHMSLSQFLRDYLYIALGGNRRGKFRRHANLLITMVLGGLWHGASWSFVLWGFLHGLYLGVNHTFRALCSASFAAQLQKSRLFGLTSWLLTIVSVIIAWVVFRAESLNGAERIFRGMVSPGYADVSPLFWNAGLSLPTGGTWCIVLSGIAFLAPNSNRIGELLLQLNSSSTRTWICGTSSAAVGFLLIVNLVRDSVSAFIYFNF